MNFIMGNVWNNYVNMICTSSLTGLISDMDKNMGQN